MNIALIGKLRSGKDYVTQYLINNIDFEHLKFSTGITEIINEYFPHLAKQGKPREAYQHIGQEMRYLDPDVWLNRVVEEYDIKKRLNCYSDNFIISDARQPNEYGWCKENGFIVIKVEASEDLRRERIIAKGDVFDEKQFYHETESHIDGYEADIIIDNNGTLEELHQRLDNVLLQLEEILKQIKG